MNILSKILNLTALAASAALMVLLLTGMSDDPAVKVVYGIIAVVLDVARQLFISVALTKREAGNSGKAIYFAAYSVFLAVSLLSGVYFAYQQIGDADAVNIQADTRRESIVNDIRSIDLQINAEINRMRNLSNWQLTEAQRQINRYRSEKRGLEKTLTEIKTDTTAIKTSTFDRIGRPFGIGGEWLKFALFLLLTAMIEMVLIATHWKIGAQTEQPQTEQLPDADMISEEREIIMKYLDNLQADDGRIRGNEKVCKLAGIAESRCRKYQKLLARMKTKDGKPVMEYVQGGATRLNTDIESIKRFIAAYK